MTLDQVFSRASQVSPALKTARLEVERMMRRLYGVRLKYYPEFRIEVEAPRIYDYNVEQLGEPTGRSSSDFSYRTRSLSTAR